jgi:hypothetical protein
LSVEIILVLRFPIPSQIVLIVVLLDPQILVLNNQLAIIVLVISASKFFLVSKLSLETFLPARVNADNLHHKDIVVLIILPASQIPMVSLQVFLPARVNADNLHHKDIVVLIILPAP